MLFAVLRKPLGTWIMVPRIYIVGALRNVSIFYVLTECKAILFKASRTTQQQRNMDESFTDHTVITDKRYVRR